MRSTSNFVSGPVVKLSAYFLPEVCIFQIVAGEIGVLAVEVLDGEAQAAGPSMSSALK